MLYLLCKTYPKFASQNLFFSLQLTISASPKFCCLGCLLNVWPRSFLCVSGNNGLSLYRNGPWSLHAELHRSLYQGWWSNCCPNRHKSWIAHTVFCTRRQAAVTWYYPLLCVIFSILFCDTVLPYVTLADLDPDFLSTGHGQIFLASYIQINVPFMTTPQSLYLTSALHA